MLTEPYASLHRQLADVIPETRLIFDPLRTLAYGTDASFYTFFTPKLIVKVENEAETIAVLGSCRSRKIAVTFRAAGTSLSGQALSDSVLIVLGPEGWRNCRISPDRDRITLGQGYWVPKPTARWHLTEKRCVRIRPPSIRPKSGASYPTMPAAWPVV